MIERLIDVPADRLYRELQQSTAVCSNCLRVIEVTVGEIEPDAERDLINAVLRSVFIDERDSGRLGVLISDKPRPAGFVLPEPEIAVLVEELVDGRSVATDVDVEVLEREFGAHTDDLLKSISLSLKKTKNRMGLEGFEPPVD